MASQRIIGMLIFPRLTQLDMTGPYEVLARMPNTTMHLVAHTLDPVKTDRGMMILPTVTYTDCPQLDLVMVPGGPGQQDLMFQIRPPANSHHWLRNRLRMLA